MAKTNRSLILIMLAVIGLFFSGCASTGGSHKLVSPKVGKENYKRLTELVVEVECNKDIALTSIDKDRILNLILKKIGEDEKNHFKSINQTATMPSTLHASVTIKRYDEGNAFARFMLAGLGQMHIDADVILTDWSTKEKIAQYEVTKTFAWGGIYGGATNIKGIEEGFAKAVAAAILGKDE